MCCGTHPKQNLVQEQIKKHEIETEIHVLDSPRQSKKLQNRPVVQEDSTTLKSDPSPRGKIFRDSSGSGIFAMARSRFDSLNDKDSDRRDRGNSQSSFGVLFRRGSRQKRNSEENVHSGRLMFSNFLKKCYSHEVLDFWDLSTEYIKACKKKSISEHSKELGKKMISEFILPGAPQKLDLGHQIEEPLVETYNRNSFDPGTFDATRAFLLKLLQGLKMDASVFYGVTSPTSVSMNAFLEDEERKMHQLRFQRDVHPLLHKFRKSQTLGSSGLLSVQSRRSRASLRASQASLGENPRTSVKI